MTWTNARGSWTQHETYYKGKDRIHVLREWERERYTRRANALLKPPPNGCAMCKCPIDGTVYLLKKRKYHRICHSIMLERGAIPRTPVCAGGQLLGFR